MTIRRLLGAPLPLLPLVAILGCSPPPGDAGELIETTGSDASGPSSAGSDSDTAVTATGADESSTGGGLDLEFCAGFADEPACTAAPPPAGAGPFVHCQWIELTELRIDEPADACVVEAPLGSCLTVEDGTDPGCPAQTCAVSWDLLFADPRARFTDDGTIQAFSNLDALCSGQPLGDWLLATDPSFGACAFHCLDEDPCAMSFDVQVALRSTLGDSHPADDCGSLTAASTTDAWQAAHDCALLHVGDGAGFRLVTVDDSAGEAIRTGYVGLGRTPYEATLLHSTTDAPYEPSSRAGAGYQATPDCVVGVGQLCLELTDPSAAVPLCGA